MSRWWKRIGAGIRSFTRNDRRWLVFYVATVLTVPALVGHSSFERPAFDEGPLDQLRREQPDIVFIGDSMLETRIDPALLSQLSGRKVSLVTDEGSASAKWFLYLKNYVAAAGVHPSRVVIFFRDRYLSDPTFRLKGQYLMDLYTAMEPGEPVVESFLDRGQQDDAFSWMRSGIAAAYPSTKMRDPAADALSDQIQDTVQDILPGETDLADQLDSVFDLRNLRPDVPSDLGSRNLTARAFDGAAGASFLPSMLEIARAHDFALTFHRVKRRMDVDGTREDAEDMDRYIADLRRHLEANGSALSDESGDPRLTLDLYGDGDHIAPDQLEHYTRLFFEAHPELFR